MGKYLIAGIGELLWDVLPDAELLGGAPVNFAYHVRALGAEGVPVSTVGDDVRGHKALAELKNRGIDTSAISLDSMHPTGYVLVQLDKAGGASYDFPDEVAWDHLQINSYGHRIQKKLDAVCFGTLAQRSEISASTLFTYLGGVEDKTLKVFDINLRQDYFSRSIITQSLKAADILKLNDDELPVLMNFLGGSADSAIFFQNLLKDFALEMIILTKGGQGSLLVTPKGLSQYRGIPVSIADTIGAGDCFTAAATIGYLEGLALEEINRKANVVASYVCTCPGAMPDIPKELKLL